MLVAARLVDAEMHRRGWNLRDLAAAADLDYGTVGDFLAGTRWPRRSTRGRIEQALDLQPGLLDRLATGQVTVVEGAKGSGKTVSGAMQAAEASTDADPRPVGYDLDRELDGLPEEDVEAVRAQIRALRRARGLS